jgi:hypothetical protein
MGDERTVGQGQHAAGVRRVLDKALRRTRSQAEEVDAVADTEVVAGSGWN